VIELAGGGQMAVRPINVRSAPPAPEKAGDAAMFFANKVLDAISDIRTSEAPPPVLFKRAETFLKQAEEQDPAAVLIHEARAQIAYVRRHFVDQALHMRRAIANGHCLVTSDYCNHQNKRRMDLAAALYNARDHDAELEVLRTVLEIGPENLHARLCLGTVLLARGDLAAAPDLMTALQLPNEAKPPWMPMCAETDRESREKACHSLHHAFMQRVLQLAAQGDHAQAIELVTNQLLRVPGIDADRIAAAHADLAKSYVVLGEMDKAKKALTTAREMSGVGQLNRAYKLCGCGQAKELEADAACASGAAAADTAALYQAAMAYYKQASALAEADASRSGFWRVQAKQHPDLKWVHVWGWYGGAGCGWPVPKSGKPINVDFEELPPGPKVEPDCC
jgi:tetratricopeptide (TPR) repeat protein